MRALGHIWPLSWPTSIWKGRRHQNTAGIPDLLLWLARPRPPCRALFDGLGRGKSQRARARNNSSWKEKEKSEGLNKWGHDSARQPAARALRATAEKQRWTGR